MVPCILIRIARGADFSKAMEANDIKPTRLRASVDVVKEFAREYFDQNPISQLGIIITYNKIARRIAPLSGNLQHQLDELDLHYSQVRAY